MTDPESKRPTNRPQRLRDGAEPDNNNDLNQPENPFEEEEEHGRIGYGRLGERTPYALAAAIILTILIIAAANWIRDSGDNDDGGDDQLTTEPQTRGEAPAFSAQLVTGETVNLSAYRGKVVVLNFWATWCGPCKEEMPALQELANANPDDVVVLGVAAPDDSREEILAFSGDLGVTYPLAADTGGGPTGAIASSYQVFGYPATFFVNADGQIVDAQFGEIPLDRLQEYIDRARSTTSS